MASHGSSADDWQQQRSWKSANSSNQDFRPSQAPQHPIPAMQGAFEESMLETTSNDDQEMLAQLAKTDSVVRRRMLLEQPQYVRTIAGRWKQKPGENYHPLWKLVAQISFGMHLLHQGLAKSDEEVIKILQTHVDEIDGFLERTTEDLDLAQRDINERIRYLKLPLEHGDVFDTMLMDRKFRNAILEGNEKIEHIVDRTSVALRDTMKDVKKGFDGTRELARYFKKLEKTWANRTEEHAGVSAAMLGNTEGWTGAYMELQEKGRALQESLVHLGGIIAEIQRRVGIASRKNLPSIVGSRAGTQPTSSASSIRSASVPQSPSTRQPNGFASLPSARKMSVSRPDEEGQPPWAAERQRQHGASSSDPLERAKSGKERGEKGHNRRVSFSEKSKPKSGKWALAPSKSTTAASSSKAWKGENAGPRSAGDPPSVPWPTGALESSLKGSKEKRKSSSTNASTPSTSSDPYEADRKVRTGSASNPKSSPTDRASASSPTTPMPSTLMRMSETVGVQPSRSYKGRRSRGSVRQDLIEEVTEDEAPAAPVEQKVEEAEDTREDEEVQVRRRGEEDEGEEEDEEEEEAELLGQLEPSLTNIVAKQVTVQSGTLSPGNMRPTLRDLPSRGSKDGDALPKAIQPEQSVGPRSPSRSSTVSHPTHASGNPSSLKRSSTMQSTRSPTTNGDSGDFSQPAHADSTDSSHSSRHTSELKPEPLKLPQVSAGSNSLMAERPASPSSTYNDDVPAIATTTTTAPKAAPPLKLFPTVANVRPPPPGPATAPLAPTHPLNQSTSPTSFQPVKKRHSLEAVDRPRPPPAERGTSPPPPERVPTPPRPEPSPTLKALTSATVTGPEPDYPWGEFGFEGETDQEPEPEPVIAELSARPRTSDGIPAELGNGNSPRLKSESRKNSEDELLERRKRESAARRRELERQRENATLKVQQEIVSRVTERTTGSKDLTTSPERDRLQTPYEGSRPRQAPPISPQVTPPASVPPRRLDTAYGLDSHGTYGQTFNGQPPSLPKVAPGPGGSHSRKSSRDKLRGSWRNIFGGSKNDEDNLAESELRSPVKERSKSKKRGLSSLFSKGHRKNKSMTEPRDDESPAADAARLGFVPMASGANGGGMSWGGTRPGSRGDTNPASPVGLAGEAMRSQTNLASIPVGLGGIGPTATNTVHDVPDVPIVPDLPLLAKKLSGKNLGAGGSGVPPTDAITETPMPESSTEETFNPTAEHSRTNSQTRVLEEQEARMPTLSEQRHVSKEDSDLINRLQKEHRLQAKAQEAKDLEERVNEVERKLAIRQKQQARLESQGLPLLEEEEEEQLKTMQRLRNPAPLSPKTVPGPAALNLEQSSVPSRPGTREGQSISAAYSPLTETSAKPSPHLSPLREHHRQLVIQQKLQAQSLGAPALSHEEGVDPSLGGGVNHVHGDDFSESLPIPPIPEEDSPGSRGANSASQTPGRASSPMLGEDERDLFIDIHNKADKERAKGLRNTERLRIVEDEDEVDEDDPFGDGYDDGEDYDDDEGIEEEREDEARGHGDGAGFGQRRPGQVDEVLERRDSKAARILGGLPAGHGRGATKGSNANGNGGQTKMLDKGKGKAIAAA